MKKLTEEFNKVTVAKGETFAIELVENASTGYFWDLKLQAGKAKFVKEDWISDWDGPPDLEPDGIGGKVVYVYKAEESGTIEISATLDPPGGGKPVKSRNFKITVK